MEIRKITPTTGETGDVSDALAEAQAEIARLKASLQTTATAGAQFYLAADKGDGKTRYTLRTPKGGIVTHTDTVWRSIAAMSDTIKAKLGM